MAPRQRPGRRILVFSASFGGGHRSAAEALVRYYQEHYADSVEVRMVDFFEEFMPGLNVLAKFAYQQSVAFFPDLYGSFFDLSNAVPSNPVVHELRIMGFQRATNYIDDFRPDAVISTFPVAGGVVSDIKLERPMVAATVITDYGVHRTWLHPATDLYFVASKEVREDLVARGLDWDRVAVSGIPVHEKFSEQLQRTECRRTLGLSDRFTVLLTSAAGLTSDVRDIAAGLSHGGVQIAAATGHNRRLKRRLDTLAKRENHVCVYGYTPDMHRMMRAADVLVGKAGGLTVSESLAVGLPLIIYNPVPGQELYNVDFLVNSGAGLLSRDEEDVVEKVRFLSTHPQRLAQMAENARLLGKPAAAQTVCERVLAAIG
ncbi:MAG TPA: glycosyltransferase [Coriobacteriia bacterium]|nr:glycosyltransferase [Coriobacteriia bacterium]